MHMTSLSHAYDITVSSIFHHYLIHMTSLSHPYFITISSIVYPYDITLLSIAHHYLINISLPSSVPYLLYEGINCWYCFSVIHLMKDYQAQVYPSLPGQLWLLYPFSRTIVDLSIESVKPISPSDHNL